MTDEIPFLDKLGDQLAHARVPPARKRRLAAGAVLAVAIVAASLAVQTMRPEPASAGVDVTRRNGQIELRLVDRETDADVIEDAIRRNGLRLQVEEVPVPDGLVGRFVTFAASTNLPPELRLLGTEGNQSFRGFTVPERFESSVTLYVGRPAKQDELYQVPVSAFERGEPLRCSGLFRARVGAALPKLSEDDVQVRWQTYTDAGASRELTPRQVRQQPFVDYLLADADSVGPDVVVVLITADGTVPFPTQPSPPQPC